MHQIPTPNEVPAAKGPLVHTQLPGVPLPSMPGVREGFATTRHGATDDNVYPRNSYRTLQLTSGNQAGQFGFDSTFEISGKALTITSDRGQGSTGAVWEIYLDGNNEPILFDTRDASGFEMFIGGTSTLDLQQVGQTNRAAAGSTADFTDLRLAADLSGIQLSATNTGATAKRMHISGVTFNRVRIKLQSFYGNGQCLNVTSWTNPVQITFG
jgi:hypothetical protein